MDQKAVNKFFNPCTKLGTPFNAELLNELYLKVLIFIGSFNSTSTAPETCHTEHTSIFFQLSKLWLVEVTQGFDSSKTALAQKKETFAKNLHQ